MFAAYNKIIIPAVAFVALLAVSDYAPVSYLVNNAHAETGIGKDVFKAVVSVFGATKEIGDILALVTVNENCKAKLFDIIQCDNCKQRQVRVAHREYVKIGDDVKTKFTEDKS